MTIINLHNLYVGDEAPPERFAKVNIGPFRVELVSDYAVKVARMGMHGAKTVSREFPDPMITVTTTSFSDRRLGGWEVTATAHMDEANATESSVLIRETTADGGIWDLCTLLTFITGRRVALDSHLDRYDPNMYGTHACTPIETLWAAAVAWDHREVLVNQHLTYAILLHNEALSQNMLQIVAGLNNTALNVLIDQWGAAPTPLNKAAKRELRDHVTTAVDVCTKLSHDEKEAFKALLGSKVDQGCGSMTDRTKALLLDLGIVDLGTNGDVDRRIKFVNAVRNSLTHKGEPPILKAVTAEVSMRFTTAIVTGVVPDIITMALGRVLGFKPGSVGSLSQHPEELQRFFRRGKWRDWPLEEVDFEDWFYSELNELEDALS